MRKFKPSHVLLLICILTVAIPAFTASCIKDADDEDQPKQPTTDTIPATDTTLVAIDSLFKASVEYLQKEWMGQYTGFDARQQTTSAIRRMVSFLPDGSYDSHVQGIVNIEDTITTYKEFEHEHGTYAFDVDKQIMTYTIEYDSLIDFSSDVLVNNPGKLRPGVGLIREYSEQIWFSAEKEGKRDWVREDENLVSTDNHNANIIYIMKSQ